MIKSIAYFFLDPFYLLFIGIALALLFYLLRKKVWFKITAYTTLAWFLVISTSYLPNIALQYLESKHPVFNKWVHPADSPIYIYVLGAGYTPDRNLNPSNQLNENALVRLVEGLRIQKFYPGSKLVLSAVPILPGYTSQAETAANAALELGVSPSDTIMLETAKNTRDEAASFLHRFGAEQNLLVVTHAYHIPRVIKTFNQAGLTIIPAPTGFILKNSPKKKSPIQFPNIYSIEITKIVMKEYIGSWILFN